MNNLDLATSTSKYDLKKHQKQPVVDVGCVIDTSITSLEALRTTRAQVTASKNGLEAICGASCDVGAM